MHDKVFEAASATKEYAETIARKRTIAAGAFKPILARLREIGGEPPRERADCSLEASVVRDAARVREGLLSQCVAATSEVKTDAPPDR